MIDLPEQPFEPRMVVAMVGLPARGKTYTAGKLAGYLAWRGYRVRIFNFGEYRRARLGTPVSAGFFDPDNAEGVAARAEVARAAMADVEAWFGGGDGQVAILDATNALRSRRAWIGRCCARIGVPLVFVESICADDATIDANIRGTKPSSPDYVGVDPEQAVLDFRARVAHYERAYQTIEDDELSYIKLIDLGRQVVVNRVGGPLGSTIATFLLSLRSAPRTTWLTRHGESEHNVSGILGGDSPLTARGRAYAAALQAFMDERAPPDTRIWTSTLRRAAETGEALQRHTVGLKSLDEIDAGVCDQMTYAQIAEEMPEEYEARLSDKLRYRYPRGESYEDVIARVSPIILELEHQRGPVVIIAHQAVLRTLYAYLTRRPRESCPFLDIPLHTVIELRPGPYGTTEQRYPLELSSV